MGLLDQLMGAITSGSGGSAGQSPIAGVLMSMLGGGQNAQQGSTAQGVPNQAMAAEGGLGGLISSFEQAGLGHVVQSWISNGPNQSVSPQQLESAIGGNQVQNMASQSGLAPHDFLSELSQHLPQLINAMTPNGKVP